MAKFFDEEVLAVNATTAVSLTSSKYDHNGSSRASKATIQVGVTPVYINFSTTSPTITNSLFGVAGSLIEITDFDNLKSAQIISQSGSGTVYVAYES